MKNILNLHGSANMDVSSHEDVTGVLLGLFSMKFLGFMNKSNKSLIN